MSSDGPILCDEDADRALRRDGYVLLPVLDADAVARLRTAYEQIRPVGDDGLVIDYHRDDRELFRAMAVLLDGVWERHLPTVFFDRIPIMASFVTKFPGRGSVVPLHLEPTFCDPAAGDAYNIWIPLEDVTGAAGNGALELLPGTERLPAWLAGYNTPHLFAPYVDYLHRHAITVDVPAGHALVFHTRMYHCSPPNRTAEPRVAFGAMAVPRTAPLIHVVATGRRERQIYAIDPAFTDIHPTEVLDNVAEVYPLDRTVEDHVAITAAEIAAAVGSAEIPTGIAPLPPDLLSADAPARVATPGVAVAGARLPVHDVLVGPRDIADDATGAEPHPGIVVTSRSGGVALAPLAAPAVARLLPDLRTLAAGRVDTAWALAVDGGGRVELEVPGAEGIDLSVYECPQVNAGALNATQIALLDVGLRVSLRGPGPVTVWNDGPGPLWAVLEVAPGAGIRRPGRLAELRRRLTAPRGR